MSRYENFDLTYVTIDSLAEGVGSSQITPLISRLTREGLKISLISFEKVAPTNELVQNFQSLGVEWKSYPFGSRGLKGGLDRLNKLRREIPKTNLIHARSDIPAVAGIASNQAPILWDVRSLWADQKVMIQKNLIHSSLYHSYRRLERLAAQKSLGMSTLTSAVVPILEARNRKLPTLRTVVSTTVDLSRFLTNRQFPLQNSALFSGTYNDYYDLQLSAEFIQELRKRIELEVHWARPFESRKMSIGVGETKVIPATQIEMAMLIPNYSFGVSVCKLNAGPSLAAAMPTKIGEFLACGRPVVVNKGLGDMDAFLEEFDAGVVLNGKPGNLAESAEKLIILINDSNTPNRCRALAEKYFSMDRGAKSYLEIYKQMGNVKL